MGESKRERERSQKKKKRGGVVVDAGGKPSQRKRFFRLSKLFRSCRPSSLTGSGFRVFRLFRFAVKCFGIVFLKARERERNSCLEVEVEERRSRTSVDRKREKKTIKNSLDRTPRSRQADRSFRLRPLKHLVELGEEAARRRSGRHREVGVGREKNSDDDDDDDDGADFSSSPNVFF